MDSNGILSVNAREESTGKSKNIKIKNEKGRLNKNEIDKMVSEAEKYKEEDEKFKVRISSRNTLESYLFTVRAAIKEYADSVDEKDKIKIEKLVNESIEWLETHRDESAALFEEKYNDLKQAIIPVMGKLSKKSLEDGDGPKIEEVN